MPDISQYNPIFQAAGAEWNVDPTLLKALAQHESGGNPNARGTSGEIGLAQFMPDTARQVGVTNRADPEQAIWGMAKYMNQALTAEHDNPTAALRYYNGGPEWRNRRTDPRYPSYVAGQYQRFAKADTGTMTDATPAPAPTADYNAPPVAAASVQANAAPPPSPPPAASTAPASGASGDDPYSQRVGGGGGTAKPAATTGTAPADDPYTQRVSRGGAGETAAAPSITDPATWKVPQDPAAQRIRQAAVEAFQSAPSFGQHPGSMSVLSPEAQNWLEQHTPSLVAAIPKVAGTVIGGVAAGGAAAMQTVNELAREVGVNPQLQRDINLLAQSAPAVGIEGGAVRGLQGAAERAGTMTPLERRVAEATGRPPPDMAPPPSGTAPPGAANTNVPPGGAQPGMGAKAAGAQVTPGYEAIHTPAEEAAYRANAEGQKLIEGQKLGERDVNQYVPGETVNNAEREQTAKTARELKELGIRVPEASQLDKEAAESNNTARIIYAQNTSKGQVEITNRRTQRETDIKTDKATVFAPDNIKGPVDFQPVVKHMQGVLDDPFNRQNSALEAAYKPLLERIKAANIEDPREAWSLMQDIDRMTSKRAQSEDLNLHAVAHQLNDVSGLVGDQVEKVAPGFDKMRATYKEHSRAIDEMTVLQGQLDKLRGTGQKLTFNDFQRFMKNVVDSRMTPSTDLNAFKAISPENMQRLWNLRDSLRRSASAKELAMAAGSDTMPNIIDALKAVGKMGGSAALHAYAFAHLGPGGNFALQSLGTIGRSLNEQRMVRRTMRQMRSLLQPSAPLRVPPGQENPLSGAGP